MTTWDDDTKRPNKAGEAYLRLYNEEWRSTGSLSPGQDTASVRGFLGDYRIRILREDHVLADFQTSLGGEDLAIDCIHDIVMDQMDCNL